MKKTLAAMIFNDMNIDVMKGLLIKLAKDEIIKIENGESIVLDQVSRLLINLANKAHVIFQLFRPKPRSMLFNSQLFIISSTTFCCFEKQIILIVGNIFFLMK